MKSRYILHEKYFNAKTTQFHLWSDLTIEISSVQASQNIAKHASDNSYFYVCFLEKLYWRWEKFRVNKILVKYVLGGRRSRGKNRNRGSSRGRVSPLITCPGKLSNCQSQFNRRHDGDPGVPGYCSESYPGDVCLVVCARGRNNVPVCQVYTSSFTEKEISSKYSVQEDGSWTDQPRCTEHVAGTSGQVTPFCPGVPGSGWSMFAVTTCLTCPGYCSLDYPGGLCTFQCSRGAHIRSSCSTDGTWAPYPTCEVSSPLNLRWSLNEKFSPRRAMWGSWRMAVIPARAQSGGPGGETQVKPS